MGIGLRYLLFIIFLLLPLAAHSQDTRPDSINISNRICTLTGSEGADFNALIAQKNQFDCTEDKYSKATDYLWLVANVKAQAGQFSDPIIRMRTSRHGDVSILRHFNDGSSYNEFIALKDMDEKWRSPYAIAVDLRDDIGRNPDFIAIGIQKPWDPQNWQDVKILERILDEQLDQESRQYSALITGLLFAPILLNFVIFIIIRQRFILYHTLMVVGIMVNHISWTGQIFDIFPSITMADRSIISHIALSAVGFAACMLIRSICNPKKLGRFLQSALLIAGSSCLLITIIVMILSPAWPLIGSQIFHIFFIIMTFTALCSLIYASLRGDKMAMLQLAGLSFAIVISIIRVGRALGFWENAPVLDLEFNIAVMLELLTISYVVGLRAYQLRKSRDEALQESKVLGLLAHSDSLTKLLNRRGFMEKYSKIAAQSEKRDINRAIMLIDIDKFKKVNDEFGHDAGDMVLVQMGTLLKNSCRENDICARLGGEEFILLISSYKENGVDSFAQRLRATINNHDFSDDEITLDKITVSIGIVMMDLAQERDFKAYYHAADKALYSAKHLGRDAIVFGQLSKPDALNASDRMQSKEDGIKKGGDEFTPAPL